MASPSASRSPVWAIACWGSAASGSSIVSMSATASPPEPGLDQSSSRAAIEEREISSSESWNSSSVMPSLAAISSSVGARASFASSEAIARSISRARARTERGTQSIERSSSMIEPLMRAIAYVSNLMSRSGSNRSIAPMSPRSPYETRSPSSTCAGRPLPRRPATYLTSGAYVRMRRSRTALFVLSLPNSCHKAWVSSTCATRGRIRPVPAGSARAAQSAGREAGQPERDRGGSGPHYPDGAVLGAEGGDGDAGEENGEDEEERAERAALRSGHGRDSSAERPDYTEGRTCRGVAQLAEHRSPKPGVA